MKAMRKQKAGPGFEGRFETREVQVVSPYRHPETGAQQIERVQKNIRHDALEHAFARRQIDAQQKANGDWFLEQCENATLGGAQAIDYSRAKVDTSFKPYAVPNSVVAAIDELTKVKKVVGSANYDLLVETIFLGRKFSEVAYDRYGPFLTEYARRDSELFVGRLWRETLEKLRDGPPKKIEAPKTGDDWRARHVNLNVGGTL